MFENDCFTCVIVIIQMFLFFRYIDAPLTEPEQQKLDVDRSDRSFFMQELLLSMLTPNETVPASTIVKKDQSPPLSSTAQSQVSQSLAKTVVSDSKHQRQSNSRPSPPPQQSTTNHVTGVPQRLTSPPSRTRQSVMQSQIPQPAANVRKQPKVTDPSPSN